MDITREEIDRIISKGTPMEKIRMYYTHETEVNYNKKGFLTDEDKRVIEYIFNRTTAERNLWSKYVMIDTQVGQSLMYLSQLSFAYLDQVGRMMGYEMIWVEIEHHTALLNNLLEEVEDKALRDRLINTIVKRKYLLHEYNRAEGYIDYEITKADMNIDLNHLIKKSKSNIEDILKLAKPYLKAFREYIIKKKFLLPPYKEALQKIEGIFTKDRALFSEFSKTKYTKQQIEKFHYTEGTVIDSEKFIYPRYRDIPLDEGLYKHYKEEIFI